MTTGPPPDDPRPQGAWTPERKRAVRRAVLIPVLTLAGIVLFFRLAIPDLGGRPRTKANEAAAVSALRNLWLQQAAFQAAGTADTDGDGVGEYGFFRELSGAVPVRTDAEGATADGTVLEPPALPTAFRTLDATGIAARAGYLFRVFLAGPDGRGVAENPTGDRVATGTLDADLCETTWCAYAWPALYGTSGVPTFFIDQSGVILSTDCPTYSGGTGSPPQNAAFTSGGHREITSPAAVDATGRDGNKWKQVN